MLTCSRSFVLLIPCFHCQERNRNVNNIVNDQNVISTMFSKSLCLYGENIISFRVGRYESLPSLQPGREIFFPIIGPGKQRLRRTWLAAENS